MAKYLIKKVEFCERCKGTGRVQHPAWIEYWQENANKQPMDTDAQIQWFRDHSWSDDLYMCTNGLPDEEIPCVACEDGLITSECDILETVPTLLSALKTYGSW